MKIKYLPFLVTFTTLVILFCFFAITDVKAESVTTSVTVGNSAPSFTAGPAESTASTTTSPTNAGVAVTFEATASDSNNENYYLAICKTNAITPSNGSAPTCGGGNWCISSSTASGSEATCSYTTLTGDSETNAWYAFVCDVNAVASSCSSSSQGTGDSGSPFQVNHVPSFTAIAEDGPIDPGGTVTWTATASDSDSAGGADTVKLIVCKTAGISNGDCDGGESDRWCVSSASASDPSCSFEDTAPTPDGSFSAYVYIVDNHNFGASSGTQGSDEAFTVNNVAPVVSAVTLNSGSNITLTEGTTTNVVLGATITDTNSCSGGEIVTVTGSLYRSGITFAGCDSNDEDDDNNCYAVVTCTVVETGNTCTGTGDASADYQCTVAVQYFADPTDSGTAHEEENWLATLVATDDDDESDNTEVSSGVEMSSLTALDVTSTINYGSLDVGQSNDPLDKVTTVTATGNVGLDQDLSGTDMDDGNSNTIPVAQQKYALATSTAYASGTSLSTTPTEAELNCKKTTSAASPETASTWWGIEIPAGTVPGSYSGTNTVTAVKGEVANW